MKSFLSEAETNKIQACVAAVETTSGAEVVPVVVGASDDYPAAAWRMGACLAFLSALALAYAFPHLDPLWFLAGSMAAFGIGILATQLEPIRRFALRDYKVDEEVHQRAIQAFHELGIHRTRQRSGVLVFVSLLEHRAEILCDVGIAAKVESTDWKRIVDELALHVRQGRLADGLCRAIEASGALVAQHFPPSAGDTNELADDVVHPGR